MFRVIFHLDMDAFYASVEQRDQPELRGKPVIVGGRSKQRGVVCAASYEARKFGVRSAMPNVTAARLCPKGIFLPVRMEVYKEESRRIREIMNRTGALIEPMSIDEAYLDLSERCPAESADEALRKGLPVARELKAQIQNERRLTASIGIASNKFLAKLASGLEKPDGLTLIPERDKAAFLRPMPIRTIHGVGKVMEKVLVEAGIHTIGELQDYSGDLRRLAGSFGPTLKRFAFGEDDRPVEVSDEVKSISSENTFETDTADRDVLRACLKEQAREIAGKLTRRHLAAHTIQVKVRYADFKTLTRQVTLEEPVADERSIYRTGCWLLGREKLVNRPLRLIGLGVAGFAAPQLRQLRLPFEANAPSIQEPEKSG